MRYKKEEDMNEVEQFIHDFLKSAELGDPDIDTAAKEDVLITTFTCGYCYYFACMLKAAFARGEVCVAAPLGHMVWRDEDGTYYDIYGKYNPNEHCDVEAFVPESYMGPFIDDFKRIRHPRTTGATAEDIADIIEAYLGEE